MANGFSLARWLLSDFLAMSDEPFVAYTSIVASLTAALILGDISEADYAELYRYASSYYNSLSEGGEVHVGF